METIVETIEGREKAIAAMEGFDQKTATTYSVFTERDELKEKLRLAEIEIERLKSLL